MNNPCKLLIIGGSSFLGNCLCQHAMSLNFKTAFTYSQHNRNQAGSTAFKLDITDAGAVTGIINNYQPHAIINLAAINPGGPEAQMEPVNSQGALHVAQAAADAKCRLIHVSTDCVHNGHQAPYNDNAFPDPINEYGRTKALGEQYIRATYPDAAMVRTSLIYSLDFIDRGIQGFLDQLEQGELRLFSDVIRQPIPAPVLSEALIRLIDIPWAGTLNIAGSQILSRAVFGKRMLDFWKVDYGDRLSTALASEIAPSMPLDLRLDITRAKQLLSMHLPGVDEYMQSFRSEV